MKSKIAEKLFSGNGVFLLFSIFISISSVLEIYKTATTETMGMDEKYYIGGMFVAFMVAVRSIWMDLKSFKAQTEPSAQDKVEDHEPTVICGIGLPHKYKLQSLVRSDTRHITLVGQNLRSLLEKDGNLEFLKKFLNKEKTSVNLILTPPDILKVMHEIAEQHLRKTVEDLIELEGFGKKRNNLKINFHPNSASLSVTIVTNDSESGVMVMIPKYARDESASDRVYCTIYQNENNGVFNKLNGPILNMVLPDKNTLTLGEVRKYYGL